MTDQFDLVLRNGQVAAGGAVIACDIGVRDGRIAALGESLAPGAATRELDATDKLVLPGGIDSHCHIEQAAPPGSPCCADDFYSGSVSAAFGGTTTIIPFANQLPGQSLRQVVADYHACARPKSIIDYAFHLIIADPTAQIMGQELPALVRDGYTSFKVYMTYDDLRLDDYQLLDVFAVARREGAMVMLHAENHDVIRWLSERLLARGHVAPKYHAVAHAGIGEAEATNRAISLAELIDVPVLIVHVSAAGALEAIRRAQARGLKVLGETCPQFLFLTADDLDRPGMEGAKYCCSPPPRDAASQDAMWSGLIDGSFQVFSSDHAPYRFDATGKLSAGPNPRFDQVANGVPGLEVRLPLLFSEGVGRGRIDIHRFVALSAGNAARIYGLHPRKGAIALGADADLAIWDPTKEVTIGAHMLHDNVGYTPYEGRKVTGWPVSVISRGRVVIEDGVLNAARGSGEFLPCAKPEAAQPLNRPAPEMDPATNFGADLLG